MWDIHWQALQNRCQENLAFFFQEGKSWQKRTRLNMDLEMKVEELYHCFITLSLPVYPKATYFHLLSSCNKHKLTFLFSTVFTYVSNKVLNKESINSLLWQKNRKDGHYVLSSKNATVQLRYLNEMCKLPWYSLPFLWSHKKRQAPPHGKSDPS